MFVYRLIATGTFEEWILAKQRDKTDLFLRVVDGVINDSGNGDDDRNGYANTEEFFRYSKSLLTRDYIGRFEGGADLKDDSNLRLIGCLHGHDKVLAHTVRVMMGKEAVGSFCVKLRGDDGGLENVGSNM